MFAFEDRRRLPQVDWSLLLVLFMFDVLTQESPQMLEVQASQQSTPSQNSREQLEKRAFGRGKELEGKRTYPISSIRLLLHTILTSICSVLEHLENCMQG
jgi:hypothetical protein